MLADILVASLEERYFMATHCKIAFALLHPGTGLVAVSDFVFQPQFL